MYKIAVVLIVLVLSAACHEGGIGMGPGASANPDVSSELAMDEIKFTDYGTVDSNYYKTVVTVDAGRRVTRTIDAYESDQLVDSCMGSSDVIESDYRKVVAFVAAADLKNYVPPSEAECEPLVGTQGVEITFKPTDGEEVFIDFGFCPLDEKIHELRSVVMLLADAYVTDCTMADVVDVFADEDADKDSDADCIPDAVETATGTDPNNVDTDGDGLPDGWIEASGMGEDFDCDGEIDVNADGRPVETDPRKIDSDGDGRSDYEEMTEGGRFIVDEVGKRPLVETDDEVKTPAFVAR